MKFTVATLVMASVAYSQTIASEVAMLPSCSLTCLTNAITGAGCSITDYSCQCGSAKSSIAQSATPCIVGACTTNDALKVQSITAEICTLAAAGSGSGGSSSAAASATSAAQSATSSAASSAVTTGSSASSAISSASSSVKSSLSSGSSASSAASRASTSAGGSATSAASSTAAIQTTNAGSRIEAVGVVGAAAMLAAFAL